MEDEDNAVIGSELDEESDDELSVEDIAVISDQEDESSEESNFYSNLLKIFTDEDKKTLASDLMELVKGDISSREGRDKQYEEGLARTGLSGAAPGGANFSGASKVAHPGLIVAALEFSSRVVPEFFPPDGPVKIDTIATSNSDRISKAIRKSKHMNWQLKYQCMEFRSIFESMISQLPFGGSQYIKLYWDKRENRPVFEFVPIDKVIIPYHCSYFYNATRITHVQHLNKIEFQSRVDDGIYEASMDVISIGFDNNPDDFTSSSEVRDKIDGKEASFSPEDGLRTVYEINCLWKMPWDDYVCPYIVVIDVYTETVLAVYRNWSFYEEEKKIRLHNLYEFTFLPWSNSQGIGLPHVIGGMSSAATGALRALLDSAHINNTPTLLKLKGYNVTGQNANPEPGSIVEIDGGTGLDDIRKLMSPIPFNPPSPVLMELLGFLTGQMQNAVKTALDETVVDSNANTPVGTQLARIEQGLKVFSSIHARIHASMVVMLNGLHRLNRSHLYDEDVKNEVGEVLAKREDYAGPVDLVPVSDPRIFSDQQRMAQAQILAGRAAAMPQVYDLRKVEERFLRTMQIPDIEDLLVATPEPKKLNSINENVAMASGTPVVAFPDQDHLAHIQNHIAFALSPILGMNPVIAPRVIPSTVSHVTQHILMHYVKEAMEVVNSASGVDVTEIMKMLNEQEDQDLENKLEVLFSASSELTMQRVNSTFSNLMPVMTKLHQIAASMQPPAPMDPTIVAMEEVKSRERIETMRIQVQNQQKETNAQIEIKKHGDSIENARDNTNIKAAQLAVESQAENTRQENDLAKTMIDARVAVETARSNESKEDTL
jgi:hypothetical protein